MSFSFNSLGNRLGKKSKAGQVSVRVVSVSGNTALNSQKQTAAVVKLTKVDQELASGNGLSVIRLLDLLIEQAYYARASDLHLDPGPAGLTARLRVDGVLQ